MDARVFISHSSKDSKVARTICTALENRGLRCWVASRDVGPGENFQESIVRAIRAARVMVLVFTDNANNSAEIKKELALASQHKLIVVPARVEDVLPSEALAYELATRQWINLFEDWEHEIENLCASIARVVPPEARPAPASAPAPAPVVEPRAELGVEPTRPATEPRADATVDGSVKFFGYPVSRMQHIVGMALVATAVIQAALTFNMAVQNPHASRLLQNPVAIAIFGSFFMLDILLAASGIRLATREAPPRRWHDIICLIAIVYNLVWLTFWLVGRLNPTPDTVALIYMPMPAYLAVFVTSLVFMRRRRAAEPADFAVAASPPIDSAARP